MKNSKYSKVGIFYSTTVEKNISTLEKNLHKNNKTIIRDYSKL